MSNSLETLIAHFRDAAAEQYKKQKDAAQYIEKQTRKGQVAVYDGFVSYLRTNNYDSKRIVTKEQIMVWIAAERALITESFQRHSQGPVAYYYSGARMAVDAIEYYVTVHTTANKNLKSKSKTYTATMRDIERARQKNREKPQGSSRRHTSSKLKFYSDLLNLLEILHINQLKDKLEDRNRRTR